MSTFFITIELFRQRVTCRIDRTIHEVYISFQIPCQVFLGLSVSAIQAQKKAFSFELFKRYIDCFSGAKIIPMHGGKQS